ncbi:MAG TPA: hypothetical protein VFN75_05625 [Pseudonocardiaceae bacterium]|nr:hypothetical protein [Pseudonocardiaceae bacterium]
MMGPDEATGRMPPEQRLADRLSDVVVGVVIGASVGEVVGWGMGRLHATARLPLRGPRWAS